MVPARSSPALVGEYWGSSATDGSSIVFSITCVICVIRLVKRCGACTHNECLKCKRRAFYGLSLAYRNQRIGQSGVPLPSFLDEAHRLHSFVPPFRFSAFFSPEDTLLCACASESALRRLNESRRHRDYTRIAELTTGSGLVGFHLLQRDDRNRLIGLDVDCRATEVAERNAKALRLERRAWFECADL